MVCSVQERHFQLLALDYGRLLRLFHSNDLEGTVSDDPTDGSYCSQPWDKQRPDEGNGQWYLENTMPLILDDDAADVSLVNKTLHRIDHVSTRYMKLFTVVLKLVSS